jgi:hypothetical protein
MPTPTIPAGNLFMNATLLTGTAATQVITNGVAGQSFQPDMVWLKSRTNANSHTLYDSIRGVNNLLYPNLTNAETAGSAQLTAFNSNGFTLGASENANDSFGELSVGWQWKAGGAAVTNTSGATQSQVSANTTSGFSVVTYTSPNTLVDTTIGHGLGATPQFIIVKNRDASFNWDIWHKDLSSGYGLVFDTGAQSSGRWSTTTPTSTVFTAKYNYEHYSTNKYVAYCWTPIAGYSAFGSYTGNASTDGPFIYTGFRPRLIIWKNISAAEAWLIEDTARSTYNEVALELYPSSSGAEAAGSGRSPTQQFDYLSNGFKIRGAQSQTNGSGNTIIYAAFAENPFKYANAR